MNSAQTIRMAEPQDQTAVEGIVEAAYSPYVARMGKPPGPMLDDYAKLIGNGYVHVLVADERIAGIIVLIPDTDAMLLDNVAVSPQSHGKGFGKQLISFAERAAREQGFDRIKLYTNELMHENISIYAKLGYVETHRASEKGYARVYMIKLLGNA
jgi:GNAT superfamily N-acetyltransferase